MSTSSSSQEDEGGAAAAAAAAEGEAKAAASGEGPLPMLLEAEIIQGFGRGSTELGIPTANMKIEDLVSLIAVEVEACAAGRAAGCGVQDVLTHRLTHPSLRAHTPLGNQAEPPHWYLFWLGPAQRRRRSVAPLQGGSKHWVEPVLQEREEDDRAAPHPRL